MAIQIFEVFGWRATLGYGHHIGNIPFRCWLCASGRFARMRQPSDRTTRACEGERVHSPPPCSFLSFFSALFSLVHPLAKSLPLHPPTPISSDGAPGDKEGQGAEREAVSSACFGDGVGVGFQHRYWFPRRDRSRWGGWRVSAVRATTIGGMGGDIRREVQRGSEAHQHIFSPPTPLQIKVYSQN